MNRLGTSSQNPVHVPESASCPNQTAAGHLIVLVPANLNGSAINRQIWKMALESNSAVQLLALYKDPEQEPTLRRDLVTMAALIQDAKVPVEIKIEKGTNWTAAVKHNYQIGDMVVCISDELVGLQRRPLSQVLESDLKVPIYKMTGSSFVKHQESGLSQIIAWLGFLGIIAGFFFLQWKVIQLQNGSVQTVLLIILLIMEFWLIGSWNSLIS